MKGNERLEKFLELQSRNMNFEDISMEIGITSKTLRSFLNKRGYKLEDGKYKIKEENAIKQIEFIDTKKDEKKTNKTNNKIESKDNKKTSNKIKETESKKEIKKQAKKENTVYIKEQQKEQTKKIKTKSKLKKDKKINLTAEDLDKLCEVYDWYLEVKDYKSMKPKKKPLSKDINIEEKDIKELKTTNLKVDKKVLEDFERLCSNSKHTKQQIITQALKNFMKEYKHLL